MERLKLAIVALLAFFCQFVSAYDFKADYTFMAEGTGYPSREVTVTLYYLINPDGNSLTVTQGDGVYNDEIVFIPESVEYEGKTYSVTKIGYQAFYNSTCKYVKMPDSITKLEDNCFYASGYLKDIVFSQNIDSIGDYAFGSCTKIVSLELHEGLKSIGANAFLGCHSISNVTLPSTLETMGDRCFSITIGLKSIVIPDNIHRIPDACFGGSGLKEITLPEGLTYIGSYAFQNSNLETIEFPADVRYIGVYSFSGTKLKEVILPEGLVSLDDFCFSNNNFLEKISFPGSLERIPRYACIECPKLHNVTLNYGNKVIDEQAFGRCPLLDNIDIPRSVDTIGKYAFYESGLVSFSFPSWINDYSQSQGLFSGCKNLQEIYMDDNVTELGATTMFQDCSALQKVRLSESIKSLPQYLFKGCSSLQTLTLPENLETIEYACFEGTLGIKEMIIPKSVKRIEGNAFVGSGIRRMFIPYATEYIGNGLLQNTYDVEEVHIQRTTPPGGAYSFSSPQIGPNTATLYVPTGSLEAYKADASWNVFSNIVEEDVPDVYFQIAYETKEGRGTATVNDEAFDNGKKEIMLHTGAVVKFIPENTGYAYSSYLLDHVMLNNKDITGELVDNAYTIEDVETNYNFEAYYRPMPLTLHVLNGNGGSVDIDVEKGKTVTFTVTPDDEWTVNGVYFNGRECTQEVLDGNKLTTPAINDDATISVTYQQSSGIKENRMDASSMKAYGSSDGTIHITGAAPQSRITVCDVDGRVITAVTASSGETTINVVPGNVYILKNGNTALKLAL